MQRIAGRRTCGAARAAACMEFAALDARTRPTAPHARPPAGHMHAPACMHARWWVLLLKGRSASAWAARAAVAAAGTSRRASEPPHTPTSSRDGNSGPDILQGEEGGKFTVCATGVTWPTLWLLLQRLAWEPLGLTALCQGSDWGYSEITQLANGRGRDPVHCSSRS